MTPMFFRLVTVDEAKDQLSVLHSSDDARIGRLVLDASQIVMDYIGTGSLSIDGWTDSDGKPLVDENGDPQRVPIVDSNGDPVLDTNGDPTYYEISMIPGPVRKATLLVIGNLDDDREGLRDPLTPGVASLLARFRDPPVA